MTRCFSAATTLGLTLALGAAACTTKERRARESFSASKGCPLDQVVAVEHPELSAYDLLYPGDEPPPEIAADTERLALWRAKKESARKATDETTTVFAVAGCGKKARYACTRGNARQGSRVSCSSLDDSAE